MSEDQVVSLLVQIRDLQKLHVENYQNALKNQQESIDLQRAAVRRQRMSVVILLVLAVALLAFMLYNMKH